MPLYESDLKLMQAAEMSDFDTGGGPPSATEIVDGQLYNMFGPKSELDTVLGRIKLRGGHAAVKTSTTDLLSGAQLMISAAPVDDNVAATLFSTRTAFDRRPQYRSFVESYAAAGPLTAWRVWGRQLAGQQLLQLWGYPDTPDLEIGAVYVLVQDEALPAQIEQYLRVTKLTRSAQTFEDDKGKFTVSVLLVELTARLRETYDGLEPSRYPQNNPRSILRTTYPASAAQYFGIRPLVHEGHVGDLEVWVDSIFNQLVPSAEAASPILDRSANSLGTTLVPGADGTVQFSTAIAIGPNAVVYLGSPFVQGTLSLGNGSSTLTDRNGKIFAGGTLLVGTCDYANGRLDLAANAPILGGTKTIQFQPAGALQAPMQSTALEIKSNNQSTTYVLKLLPIPNPGTAQIHYRAQGKWYVLYDQGDGSFAGADSSYGAAQLTFTTGSLAITLGALPDVGSYLLVLYGVNVYSFLRGGQALAKAGFEITTTHDIPPGGLSVSWPYNGETKTATDDGDGAFTGDATGEVDYDRRRFVLRPEVLPPPGTQLTVTITPRNTATETHPSVPRDGDGKVTVSLAHGNVVPGSVYVQAEVTWTNPPAYTPPINIPPSRIFAGG